MGKHHQQVVLLGQSQSQALVQLVGAGGLPEEPSKRSPARVSLGTAGVVSVSQEVSVQLPEARAEGVQDVALRRKAWRQFLVGAIFMEPAQSECCRQTVELGRLVTEEEVNHWAGRLGSRGSDGEAHLSRTCGGEAPRWAGQSRATRRSAFQCPLGHGKASW